MTRSCTDCGIQLSAPRKGKTPTGRCRSCAPKVKMTLEVRAKLSESVRARHERERHDAVAYAAKVESGRRLRAAFGPTQDMVAKQIAGRRRTHWVPAGYEQLNFKLRRKRIPLDERQSIIRAQAASDERDRLAAMTPFERQLERVRNGARLVAKPDTRPTGPSMTLGGVTASDF